MTKLEIYDNIEIATEKLGDIAYLTQEIREEYFERYNDTQQSDRDGIAWDYHRYAALYRILDNCIHEVTILIREIDKELNKTAKAVAV